MKYILLSKHSNARDKCERWEWMRDIYSTNNKRNSNQMQIKLDFRELDEEKERYREREEKNWLAEMEFACVV